MDDKSKLIESLQINREHDQAENSSRVGLWIGVAVVVVAIGALGWWWSSRHTEVVTNAEAASSASSMSATTTVATSGSRLDASGYVVARRQAVVSPSGQQGGKVIEVLIKEGSRVKQGDILARLDDRAARLLLAQSQTQVAMYRSQLHTAEVTYGNAEPTYKRAQKSHSQGYLSDQEFDDAKSIYDNAKAVLEERQQNLAYAEAQLATQERNLTDTVVRAPFDGVITAKNADVGEFVMPGAAGGTRTGIGSLVDMDSLEVEVDVSENFINRVQAGQPATVKLNAYPDWEIPAEVIAVIPTADRAKATVKVRIGFKQKDPRILPEMGARVAFLEVKQGG